METLLKITLNRIIKKLKVTLNYKARSTLDTAFA